MVVKWRVAHWRNAVHAARTWTHGRRLGEGGLWVDCGWRVVDCGLALCPFEMRRRSALAGTAGLPETHQGSAGWRRRGRRAGTLS